MASGDKITFACGEFLPGKETIGTPGIKPPAPPIFIPKPAPCCTEPPGKKPVEEEWVCVCTAACSDSTPNACQNEGARKCVQLDNLQNGQNRGSDIYPTKTACEADAFNKPPCWLCGVRCDVYDPLPCPPPFQNVIKFIKKECVVCQPRAIQDARCIYKTVNACQQNCASITNVCPDPGGGGGVPGLPPPTGGGSRGGPITPGGGGGGSGGGPITPEDRFRCVVVPTYCPDGRTVKQFLRSCVYCGPSNDPNLPKDCTLNRQDCATRCKSSPEADCPGPITPGENGRIPPGRGEVTDVTISTKPPPGNIVIINENARRGEVGENIQNFGGSPKWRIFDNTCKVCTPFEINNFGINCPYTSESECLSFNTSILNNEFTIVEKTDSIELLKATNLDTLEVGMLVAPDANVTQLIPAFNMFGTIKPPTIINIEAYASGVSVAQSKNNKETIYDGKFNFFKYRPIEEFNVVANSSYLNIFKPVVAKEIAYVLSKNGNGAAWSEYPYTQITKSKLIYSIRTDLLSIFNSLIYQTGQPILLDYFLQMVLTLLLTDRLDEFDFNIYKELAEKQAGDERIVFQRSQNQTLQEKAALGIISSEAKSYDPNKSEGSQKLQMLRARALNEDIEAVIPVERFATLAVVDPVPIPNTGLEVEVYNEGFPSTTDVVPLGDGDGYYISATTITLGTIPLYLSSQLSSTFYLPQDTRLKVLDLFNIDPTVVLSVSSTYTKSEFGSNYNTTTVSTPLYFSLNLSTVGDSERINSLVDTVSGIYTLQTSADANTHARNYGLNVVRVNVDYRDPFYVYALNASSVSIRLSDITFRSMAPSRGSNNQILARSIPFGFVLVPGMGSEHNPFATFSKLANFDSIVQRELELIPTILKAKTEQDVLALDEKLLFDEINAFQFGIGGVKNTQNVLYTFNPASDKYALSYYTSGSYASTIGNRSRPIQGKLVYDIIESRLKTFYTLQADMYGTSSITWWDVFRRLTATEYASLGVYAPDKLFNKLALGWRNVNIRDVLNRQDSGETGIVSTVAGVADTAVDIIYLTETDRENAKSY